MLSHSSRTAICLLAVALISCVSAFSAETDAPPERLSLVPVGRFDLAGAGNAEIVSICKSSGLVVTTNSRRRSIDFRTLRACENPVLDPVSIWAGVNGLPTIFEPTSVAVHPQLPIAFATITGRSKTAPGRLIGIDLRPESMGLAVVSLSTGIGPDSVAVSPNGKWLIIANEAEEDAATGGSIQVVSLDGLNIDGCPADNRLVTFELTELDKRVGSAVGDCEPEFVAFDPLSRFAVVTCQENDCVIVIDLQIERPAIVNTIRLPEGAQPDGVAVLPFVMGPIGSRGCLIGIAEEGGKGVRDGYTGNMVSFCWIDPEKPGSGVALMSRTDVRPWVDPMKPNARLDPEGIVMGYYSGKPFAVVCVERADCVLCLDLTDPMAPKLAGKEPVGSRPEGLAQYSIDGKLYIVAACEGTGGDGTVSLLELRGCPDCVE